jgi:hypothetical protein
MLLIGSKHYMLLEVILTVYTNIERFDRNTREFTQKCVVKLWSDIHSSKQSQNGIKD